MREMKDSGIEWIGEIPMDWGITKLKHIIRFPLQYGANEPGIEYSNELPRYIRITDITADNRLKEEGKLSLGEETAKPYLLCDFDILFARSGSVGKTFLYKEEYGKAAFAGYLIRAAINSEMAIPKYVYYTTLGQNYDAWKKSIFVQVTIQNISADKYSNYVFACPSLSEQQRIVDLLDVKCAEIDKILFKTRASIEEYRKLKQAVITQAVTKGVRGDREMKDSGIEWIGEIPIEWNQCKLKNVSVRIGDGLHGTPEFDDSGDAYFVNGNNIGEKFLEIKSDTKRLSIDELEKYPSPDLNNNTIMITLNGATYGKVSLYKSYPVLLGKSAGYITLIETVCREYIRYYLMSSTSKLLMLLSLNGTTIQNLSLTTLNNFPTLLPSIGEQQEIVHYLDAKVDEIDAIIMKKGQCLIELESYKKSLIYEYVTGKKEVPQ